MNWTTIKYVFFFTENQNLDLDSGLLFLTLRTGGGESHLMRNETAGGQAG